MLLELLNQFKTNVNAHGRIRQHIQDWNPEFFIESQQQNKSFQVRFSEGLIDAVEESAYREHDEVLLVSAEDDVLQAVFSGKLNPLRAYANGDIEMYGPTRDQVKLDTVCLLLWGI